MKPKLNPAETLKRTLSKVLGVDKVVNLTVEQPNISYPRSLQNIIVYRYRNKMFEIRYINYPHLKKFIFYWDELKPSFGNLDISQISNQNKVEELVYKGFLMWSRHTK